MHISIGHVQGSMGPCVVVDIAIRDSRTNIFLVCADTGRAGVGE